MTVGIRPTCTLEINSLITYIISLIRGCLDLNMQEISFADLEKRVEFLSLVFDLTILPSQKEPVKPLGHKQGLSTELALQVPPFLQGSGLQIKFAPTCNKITQLKLTRRHYVIKISPFITNTVHLN